MRLEQKLAKRLLSISRYSTIVLIAFFVSSLAVYTYTRVSGDSGKVYAATSSTLNFQGRLYTSSGKVVSDGYYNLEFKLYDGGTQGGSAGTGQANAGSLLWTEDWYDSNGVSAGNDNRVRVVNGYFTVNLGSQAAFPGAINWEQELWLTMNVGGSTQTATPTYDGEMLQAGNTRTKLTAVPYAFEAGSAKKLIEDQLSGTGTLQFSTLTANRTISLPDADGTVLLDSTGFKNGGNSFGGLATLGTNDTNGLVFETDSSERLRVDSTGNVSIGTGANGLEKLEVNGGIKLGNSTGTNAGTLRWTGTDFEGYDGVQWVSLTNGGGTTIIGTSSTSFTSGAANLPGTATGTATGILSFTSATAVSSAVVNTFQAPAAGSFRSCTVIGNAARTAGTVTLRWSVNGSSVGTGVCVIDGTNTSTSSSSINSQVVTFSAGDTIGVVFDSSGFTPTNTDFTVYWSVDYDGSAPASGNSFVDTGNAFGHVATLGTTDTYGLNIITNNTTALSISNTGSATFADSLAVANGLSVTAGGASITAGGLTVSAGGANITGNSTISGTLSGLTGLTFASGDLDLSGGSVLDVGPNITASAGLAIASSGSGDLSLTSASGLIDLNGSIWRRVASGTTTIQLNDTADTTLSVENIGTGVANLSVDGSVTATSFSGSGSGLTSLDGANISSGTINDARLSSNVALLNGGQTFTGLTTFNDALVVGNTASSTAGAIRWTGSDFEGYDGLAWVSLTSGGGGAGSNVTTVMKASNETVNNSSTLQDDNDLHFPIGASEAWSFRFVVQASSGTVPNLKFAVTAPSGAVCKVSYSDPEGATSDGQIGCGVSTASVPGNGATDLYEITGTVTNGTTAGNVRLQWAQFTTDASNTIVYAGSYVNAFPQSTYTAPPSTVYVQGGNSFGGTAILGTGDNNGLNIVTNGSTRLSFASTGEATFANDVTFNTAGTFNGALTLNGDLTIGDNSADGLTIVSGNVALTNGLNFDSNTFVIDSTDNQVGIGTSTPLNTLTINAPNTADAAAQVLLYTNGAANKGLIIQRTASQSANLFEAQDESGNALSYITPTGGFVLGRSSFSNGTLTFKNSSNAFTSTFSPGALSVDRTITLPDSSGVVCLDSNNCSYVKLAAGSVQTDGTNSDVISINKTSGTGNLLTLQRSGAGVFTIFNSGALQLQLTSTTALSVLSSGGTSLFNVDTSANVIRIGGTTADSTGALLVLDTKNTAGDPTGIDGASYYNSVLGASRCYENGYWSDCETTRSQGDTTLGSAAASVSVSVTDTGETLRCTLQAPGVSTANLIYLRFNGIATGTPYGYNLLKNLTGANNNTTTESTAAANQIALSGTSTVSASASFTVDIDNFSTSNKSVTWTGTRSVAATIPQRFNGSGTYFNTSSGITSVDFVTSTGNFNAGTRAWCSAR